MTFLLEYLYLIRSSKWLMMLRNQNLKSGFFIVLFFKTVKKNVSLTIFIHYHIKKILR